MTAAGSLAFREAWNNKSPSTNSARRQTRSLRRAGHSWQPFTADAPLGASSNPMGCVTSRPEDPWQLAQLGEGSPVALCECYKPLAVFARYSR